MLRVNGWDLKKMLLTVSKKSDNAKGSNTWYISEIYRINETLDLGLSKNDVY